MMSRFSLSRKKDTGVKIGVIGVLRGDGNNPEFLLPLSNSDQHTLDQWNIIQQDPAVRSQHGTGNLALFKVGEANSVDFPFTTDNGWVEGVLYRREERRSGVIYYLADRWNLDSSLEDHDRICNIVEPAWAKLVRSHITVSRDLVDGGKFAANVVVEDVELGGDTSMNAEHHNKAVVSVNSDFACPHEDWACDQHALESVKGTRIHKLAKFLNIKKGQNRPTKTKFSWDLDLSSDDATSSQLNASIKAKVFGVSGEISSENHVSSNSKTMIEVEFWAPEDRVDRQLPDVEKVFVSPLVPSIKASASVLLQNRLCAMGDYRPTVGNPHDINGLVWGNYGTGKSSLIYSMYRAVHGKLGCLNNNINDRLPKQMVIRSSQEISDGTHVDSVLRYKITESDPYRVSGSRYRGNVFLHDTTGLRVSAETLDNGSVETYVKRWTEAQDGTFYGFTATLVPSFSFLVFNGVQVQTRVNRELEPYIRFVEIMRGHGIVHPVIVVFTHLDDPIVKCEQDELNQRTRELFGDLIADVVFIRNYIFDPEEMKHDRDLERELYEPEKLAEFSERCTDWKAQNDELLAVLKRAVAKTAHHEKETRENESCCIQ